MLSTLDEKHLPSSYTLIIYPVLSVNTSVQLEHTQVIWPITSNSKNNNCSIQRQSWTNHPGNIASMLRPDIGVRTTGRPPSSAHHNANTQYVHLELVGWSKKSLALPSYIVFRALAKFGRWWLTSWLECCQRHMYSNDNIWTTGYVSLFVWCV